MRNSGRQTFTWRCASSHPACGRLVVSAISGHRGRNRITPPGVSRGRPSSARPHSDAEYYRITRTRSWLPQYPRNILPFRYFISSVLWRYGATPHWQPSAAAAYRLSSRGDVALLSRPSRSLYGASLRMGGPSMSISRLYGYFGFIKPRRCPALPSNGPIQICRGYVGAIQLRGSRRDLSAFSPRRDITHIAAPACYGPLYPAEAAPGGALAPLFLASTRPPRARPRRCARGGPYSPPFWPSGAPSVSPLNIHRLYRNQEMRLRYLRGIIAAAGVRTPKCRK